MSKRSLAERLFWRPPHVTSFQQWVRWRGRRNWRKVVTAVQPRIRPWSYALRHTVRSAVFPDVTFVLQPSRSDPVTDYLVRHGVWEPIETAILLRLVRPGATVLDIGANLGHHTVVASRLVGPTGRVIAFEPEPGNVGLLAKNLERNRCDNVEVHAAAVSDRSGASATLHVARHNLGDHRTFHDAEDEDRERVSVATTAVDDVVGDDPVDVVKMDIQGGEGQAVVGMDRVLRRNRDLVILFEFWPYGLQRAATDPGSLLQRLEDLDFALHRVLPVADARGSFVEPTTPAAVLDSLARARFEDSVNLIAARARVTLPDLAVGPPWHLSPR